MYSRKNRYLIVMILFICISAFLFQNCDHRQSENIQGVSKGDGPDPSDDSSNEIPGIDSSEMFPIDRGDEGAYTPSSYKGLPLRLVKKGQASVTAVNGKIGVICIGMSNANFECRQFIEDIENTYSKEINPEVVVVNCSVGSHAIEKWNNPEYDYKLWDACISGEKNKIKAAGLDLNQIRVIYHKAALQKEYSANYPEADSYYENFYTQLGIFAGLAKSRLPALQAVYTTSRGQGYFASKEIRGEPMSYEQGHALNKFLADKTDTEGFLNGVYHTWGPYIWAGECSTGKDNASGYCYVLSDFQLDGIHPAVGAREKISEQIHRRFLEESWYSN